MISEALGVQKTPRHIVGSDYVVEHGSDYVVEHGSDYVVEHTDSDNLSRAIPSLCIL